LEPVSEDVEQGFARFYCNLLPDAVDLKNQLCRAGTEGFLIIQSFCRLRDSCRLGQGADHCRGTHASEKISS